MQKEGVVIALVNADQTKGIVLRVSCETDPVAKMKILSTLPEASPHRIGQLPGR